MKKNFKLFTLILIAALFTSCSKDYRKIISGPEKEFYRGNYKKAANMLKPFADKKDINQLLYMMEAGYMFHAAGDYKTSNSILLKAAGIARIKPVSVTKQVKSLLTSDRSTNYRGEDFEKVLIHMYAGLNFLMLKNYESARVEFKAVNEELQKIKTETGRARYKQNIMAKYLTAISYEIIGTIDKSDEDLEYAYIEYKQIHKLNPGLQMVKKDLLRLSGRLKYMDDYRMWQNKFKIQNNSPKKTGEVIVVYQAGRSAIKVSRGRLLSDKGMNASIRLSLQTTNLAAGVTIATVMVTLRNAENPIPKFKRRSNRAKSVQIVVNGKKYMTTMLENIEQTAIQNLRDDYSRLKKKVAASVAVKAVASVAAGIVAKKIAQKSSKKLGAFSGLIGLAAGLGTGAALFSQMKPDLRCWHTLPANLQLGRIFLKPGKYSIILNYIGIDDSILRKKQLDINLKSGEKVFINQRTLN